MSTVEFNKNPAIATSFKLVIPKFEEYNYFVQQTALPSLSLSGISNAFKAEGWVVPDNTLQYGTLSMQIIVDEDFGNIIKLQDWMRLGWTGDKPIVDEMQDIKLIILNSNKQPKLFVTYTWAFPTSIGDIPLDSTDTSASVLTTNVEFMYQDYSIEKYS